VQNLKDAIPTALEKQKEASDLRLKEVNTELKSLKTLITQRMSPPTPAGPAVSGSHYLRPSSGNAAGGSTSPGATTPGATGSENADASANKTNGKSEEQPKKEYQDYVSGLNRSSPFSSGAPAAKASIPAWQMAMAKKNNNNSNNAASSSDANGSSSAGDAAGSGSPESA
jgi:peroxin-14